MMNPVQKAINHCGSVTNLANRLGVSINNIINWRSRGVPAEWCAQIEQATDGAVSRCDLFGDGAEKLWPEVCEVGASSTAQKAGS